MTRRAMRKLLRRPPHLTQLLSVHLRTQGMAADYEVGPKPNYPPDQSKNSPEG